MDAKTKRGTARTVDAYLARFSGETRKTLDDLRQIIRSTAPDAEELISYGIPAYKLNGMLLGFGGFKAHCSLFGMSRQLTELAPEVMKYQTGPGTLRFQPGKKLPVVLIRKLIKGRMIEHEMRARKKNR